MRNADAQLSPVQAACRLLQLPEHMHATSGQTSHVEAGSCCRLEGSLLQAAPHLPCAHLHIHRACMDVVPVQMWIQ